LLIVRGGHVCIKCGKAARLQAADDWGNQDAAVQGYHRRMDVFFSADTSLGGLFIASFLAATLLPGGSEAVFVAVLAAWPDKLPAALLLATLGNTLGGMSSYLLARLLPEKSLAKLGDKPLALTRRWGSPVLILAWVPLVGDLLCVTAGWLRLPWPPCMVWMALGKGLRYAFIAAGWQLLAG
jgi:membrane protein YqaA with SNARE-associated domain